MYNSLYDALERIYPEWNGKNIPEDFRKGMSNLENLLKNLEELHEMPLIIEEGLTPFEISNILGFGRKDAKEKGNLRSYDTVHREVKNGINWILTPARIITLALEYKQQVADPVVAQDLLLDSIDFALGVYQNPDLVLESTGQFRERILEKNSMMLFHHHSFNTDGVSMHAYQPRNSRSTVETLLSLTDGNPVTFIAIANGGVPAGMDVFLRYRDEILSPDGLTFYSTKLSCYKDGRVGKKRPKIKPWEIRNLHEITGAKPIVLFDEDVNSGETLARARDFFRKYFPENKIIVETNMGSPDEVDYFSKSKRLSM